MSKEHKFFNIIGYAKHIKMCDFPSKVIEYYVSIVKPYITYSDLINDFDIDVSKKDPLIMDEAEFMKKIAVSKDPNIKDRKIAVKLNSGNLIYVSNQIGDECYKPYKKDIHDINVFLGQISKLGIPWEKDDNAKGTKPIRVSPLRIDRKVIKIRVKDKILVPEFGYDPDSFWIRYDSDVSEDERVPGLVGYLNEEYSKIIDFAYTLFAQNDESMELNKIQVILSKERFKKHYPLSDDDVARRIYKLIEKYGRNVSENEIRKIIRTKSIHTLVLGKYIHNGIKIDYDEEMRPVIYIYYLNFGTSDRNYYFGKMSQVLSHEYFHHIHDLYVGYPQFSTKSSEAEDVRESLADFFSFLYLVRTNMDLSTKQMVASDLYDSWDINFETMWPYAKALYYFFVHRCWIVPIFNDFSYYLHNCCVDKMFKVLNESKTDFELALKILKHY